MASSSLPFSSLPLSLPLTLGNHISSPSSKYIAPSSLFHSNNSKSNITFQWKNGMNLGKEGGGERNRACQPILRLLSYTLSKEDTIISRKHLSSGCTDTSIRKKRAVLVVFNQKTEENENKGSSSTSFLSFFCPLLKFLGGDPTAPRNRFLEVTTSGLASLSRLPWGTNVSKNPKISERENGEPIKMLQLYEFEACPFCRRVRESLTELDLSVEVYPCPKNSVKHRKKVLELGGKDQYPFLVDPNTNISMYESGDIVKYLFRVYGGGSQPTFGLLESTPFTGWMPTIFRVGRGMTLALPQGERGSGERETLHSPLQLYSYENNQFARLVREALCELEMAHVVWNAGKGSKRRDQLLQISGSTQVPYIIDPNTGVSMGESDKIVEYLFRTYGNQSLPLTS